MIHIGRCGSTALARMLKQHPDITWDGEIYWRAIQDWKNKGGTVSLDQGHFRPWRHPGITTPDNQPPMNAYALLARYMSMARKPVYGFELKFYHLTMFNVTLEDFLNYLQRIGFDRFIVIGRRNYLRQVVSYMHSRSSGQMHIPRGMAPRLAPITIPVDAVPHDYDTRSLVDIFKTFDRNLARLSKLLEHQRRLELVYEDDIQDDPRAALHRILEFTGLSIEPSIEVATERSTPFQLSEVVSNLEEVRETLADTPYSWMAGE